MPWPFCDHRVLAASAGVVLDDRVGGLENRVRRAVVLLQLHDLHLGVMLFEVEQVGDLRATPAVDGLVIVADDAEVAVLERESVDELKLCGVGV